MTTERPKLHSLKPPPAPPQPTPAAPAKTKPGPNLTFSDGLNFGCGFWVAGALFSLFALPAGLVLFTILGGVITRLATQ